MMRMTAYRDETNIAVRRALSKGSTRIVDWVTPSGTLLNDITGLNPKAVSDCIETELGFGLDPVIITDTDTVGALETTVLDSRIYFDTIEQLDEGCPVNITITELPENTVLGTIKRFDATEAAKLLRETFGVRITPAQLQALSIEGCVKLIRQRFGLRVVM